MARVLKGCLRCGRNSIGVDIDRDYMKIARKRLENEQNGLDRRADVVMQRF